MKPDSLGQGEWSYLIAFFKNKFLLQKAGGKKQISTAIFDMPSAGNRERQRCLIGD